MVKLTRGERFKDARRVHNQHGSQSLDKVAQDTGISKSLIQALEEESKERSVGYDKIVKLAQHYGVSTDWLLGLTEVRSTNTTLRDVCEYTGFSEEVITRLKLANDYLHPKGITMDGLNKLLSSGLIGLAGRIMCFCNAVDNALEESKAVNTVSIFADGDCLAPEIEMTGIIEELVQEKHPEFAGRYKVITGCHYISAERRAIVDEFSVILSYLSNYEQLSAILYKDNGWNENTL